jgi:hypothetical protein
MTRPPPIERAALPPLSLLLALRTMTGRALNILFQAVFFMKR